jgi:hypothetical protein
MGDRSWRRRDADGRSRALAAARPEGAPPPAPMLARDPEDPPPVTSVPAVEAVEPVAAEREPAPADALAIDDATVDGESARVEVAADDDDGDDARVEEPQPAERS